MILGKNLFSEGMFVLEDYLLPREMHPDLMKYPVRDAFASGK